MESAKKKKKKKKSLVEWMCEAVCSWSLILGELFDYCLNFIAGNWSFRFYISPWLSLERFHVSKNLFILVGVFNFLTYNFLYILISFYNFYGVNCNFSFFISNFIYLGHWFSSTNHATLLSILSIFQSTSS